MNISRKCQYQNQVKEIENGQQSAHRKIHVAIPSVIVIQAEYSSSDIA